MTGFVALLRGINVAGSNKVTMEDLRELVRGLGHTDVSTYLQSGNVLFTSSGDAGAVASTLERALADRLDVNARVLLRTGSDLDAVLAANPYLGQESDPTKLHVTFLAEAPEPDRASVPVPTGETGVLTVHGREVYLHCPAGYGRTKLTNSFLERKLGRAATTRNWKSVLALHGLLTA